jgi:outer membrane protein insertion porin family
MSSSVLEDDVFEKLQEKVDPEELKRREQEANATMLAQYERHQQRIGSLVDSSSTLPVTISSVRVLHASHTRKGFLQRICSPLLSANRDEPYTLHEALRELSLVGEKLSRFDIFQSPISMFIDKPSPSDPNTSPSDIDVILSCTERSRIMLKSGTEAGHAEGSAYVTAFMRNLFGGAESLTLNGSLGTRTKSSYRAVFNTPILSDPGLRFEVAGIANAVDKPWASHNETQRGGGASLKWESVDRKVSHEIAYWQLWRQVTGLAQAASPTIRGDAGDSVKSAFSHRWEWDRRDNWLLPTRGLYLKTTEEIAGSGPLGGDVAFAKVEFESQAAVPLISSYSKEASQNQPTSELQPPLAAAASLSASFRAGFLQPLALGLNGNKPAPSRINDRFVLGGPTDIRGFRLAGIGPRDGGDATGGDAYAAAGMSLLLPFPRVAPETPLRFQAFVNAGRMVAIGDDAGSKGDEAVESRVKHAWRQMSDGWPSCAAGIGVVYAHPAARFEVNFSLPLVTRAGEEGRKGLQFGVGLSFM